MTRSVHSKRVFNRQLSLSHRSVIHGGELHHWSAVKSCLLNAGSDMEIPVPEALFIVI